jgi:hypothetical protein
MQRLINNQIKVVVSIKLEQCGEDFARKSTEPAIVPPAGCVNTNIHPLDPSYYTNTRQSTAKRRL